MIKWVGHVACAKEHRIACNILVENREEKKRSLRRDMHRWEDNIKICLK